MPPVGGLPSRAEPRPIPSRAAKLHLASGVADKTTALPDEPTAHLPSKRRGLRYNSGAELTATPTAASRSKRRHCRRQCRSLRRQGSEQGAARNERGAARANNLKQTNSTPFFYNCLCVFSRSGSTDTL